MAEIHCHHCGGFIAHPAGTVYRAPSGATAPAPPHSGLCACGEAVVYGAAPAAPEFARWLRGVHRIRSASRN